MKVSAATIVGLVFAGVASSIAAPFQANQEAVQVPDVGPGEVRLPLESFMPSIDEEQAAFLTRGTMGVPATRTFTEMEGAFSMIQQNLRGYRSNEAIAHAYAIAIMEHQGFMPIPDFITKNAYTDDHTGITHVYFRQIHDSREIFNADFNINVDMDGRLLSFSNGFFNAANALATVSVFPKDAITAVDALVSFYDSIGYNSSIAHSVHEHEFVDEGVSRIGGVPFAKQDVLAKRGWLQRVNGSVLSPVWSLDIDMGGNWFNAFVSAGFRAEVLGRVDWVSDATSATYNVYALGVAMDPLDGDRSFARDPADAVASPDGWHDVHAKNNAAVTTYGNNVFAQNNPSGRGDYQRAYRPKGTKSLGFNFPLDLTLEPKAYEDAAITNLFYWNNIMHDVFYRYGFNEQAGNFQEDNYGRGGRGGDGVIANAQDGSGTNNANFATPPDGRKGRMRMYVWTMSKPSRDGDLDSGIIVHEYGHGISTRLTGGPANSGCLGWGESGGLGEGWSDIFAVLLNMRANYNRTMEFPMGVYAAMKGIRQYPYSTDMKKNRDTYASVKKYYSVHAKGAVWANMLLEVYFNMVEEHGFEPDWYNAQSTAGNIMLLQLIVDGMKLQPCRPTFLQARDAILQADQVNYGGKNTCLLWKGFAKRGLGYSAGSNSREDYTVPSGCVGHVPKSK